MNNELKQIIDTLRELPSDIDRKIWFDKNSSSIVPLLVDTFLNDKDQYEFLVDELLERFPRGTKGSTKKLIKSSVRLIIETQIRERNKDHFTEEVNFERDAQGNVRATIENIVLVLTKNKNLYPIRDEFTGMYYYAAFGTYDLPWSHSTPAMDINFVTEHAEKGVKSIRYYNAMGSYELASIKGYLQQFFKAETNWKMLKEAIIYSAQQNVVNVYQDFMRYGLPEWDGIDRLDFLHRFAGVKNKKWATIVAKTMLLAIIARCFFPGYDYRGIIILEGKQNIGKSRTAKVFSFHPDFFTQFTFDKNHNEYEVSRRLAGKAIIEFPDMGGITSRDTNYIKAFFTQTTDSNRRMHNDLVESVKRSWVPIITTNYSEPYLNDQTGNSRYLTVACETDRIDVESIEREMPMLLAQALAMWKAGETPRLNNEEIALQEQMLKPREIVSDYYYWLLPLLKLHQKQFIRTDEHWDDGETLDKIVDWCSGEDWFPSKPRHYHKRKIATILRDRFKIESVIRFKQSSGPTRKHRYVGETDFEMFLSRIGDEEDDYS